MVKNTSLSSDIDLIKELEELRIKQKLLVETLAKKEKLGKNEGLAEIIAKLDFLVKIFQESISEEHTTEKPDELKISDVDKKLTEIEEKMQKNFETLLSKIDKISKTQTKTTIAQPEPKKIEKKEEKLPPVPNFTNEKTALPSDTQSKTQTSNSNPNQSIPEPTSIPISENTTKDKKKSRWF